jgi:DNA-binding transcriptional ArsR family regulator
MVVDSALLAAIASPRRREILRLVWQDERSAGEIHRALGDVTFGAVSLQLRALGRAGAVVQRADGRQRFYRANRKTLASVAALLESMWNDALWKLKLEAELEQTRRGPRPQRRRGAGPSRSKQR